MCTHSRCEREHCIHGTDAHYQNPVWAGSNDRERRGFRSLPGDTNTDPSSVDRGVLVLPPPVLDRVPALDLGVAIDRGVENDRGVPLREPELRSPREELRIETAETL